MIRRVRGPLSDAFKASDNGGRMASGVREHGTKKPAGGTAPAGRSESVDPAKRARALALAREAEDGGSPAANPRATYLPLADRWAAQHHSALVDSEKAAEMAAMRSGKPWMLHADQQTQAILAECPIRAPSPVTLAAYRRDYERLRERGLTPLEAATTRAHWDRLRTACRVSMEQDIRAWRAASERARRRGDIASAQRRTERAFRLAVVMDELFIQATRRTWGHKAAEMSAAGIKQVRRSKRSTIAPAPDLAAIALLAGSRRGTRIAERHGERLAALALFGFRPAELMKGVQLQVTGRTGAQYLTAQVTGAKVSGNRGQEARVVRVPVEGTAAAALAQEVVARGGQWTVVTTPADYRSLNRALKSGADISCYTFRHQVGSECKGAIAAGQMSPEEAARVMGHRSTASLSFYGSQSKSRGGRRMRANATNEVRVLPVTYAQRAEARTQAKAVSRVRSAPPTPQPRPQAAPQAATPSIKSPRPKRPGL